MIKAKVQGFPAIDGGGVHLIRVLSNNTYKDFNPFLMLDSFDTDNYDDYKEGFPMHPHRGIETLTYISKGKVSHEDSMGNKKTVADGGIQWMTTGSGIMHSEKFDDVPRLLGLQLWLNMPAKEKMDEPKYLEIKPENAENFVGDGFKLKVMAGTYKDKKGADAPHNPLDYYVVKIDSGKEITIDSKKGYTNIIFTLIGDVEVDGEKVNEKTAASLSGEKFVIKALNEDVELVWFASPPLDEPMEWYGPIVMNTREELYKAFQELRNGTFIKEKLKED